MTTSAQAGNAMIPASRILDARYRLYNRCHYKQQLYSHTSQEIGAVLEMSLFQMIESIARVKQRRLSQTENAQMPTFQEYNCQHSGIRTTSENIMFMTGTSGYCGCMSNDDTLIYLSERNHTQFNLAWMNRDLESFDTANLTIGEAVSTRSSTNHLHSAWQSDRAGYSGANALKNVP